MATNKRAGRFAPSPTGPLHFGSLVAALGSYLDARAQKGQWLVRMEDLDMPRVQPGATARILRTLEQCGFEWDGPVTYQMERISLYQDALDRLSARGAVYPCGCSRKEVADSAPALDGARIYPGTCRNGIGRGRKARAFRVRTESTPIEFVDRLQGRLAQNVEAEVGDYVLLRADGLIAYQLAVVVDDAAQTITDVVRGSDLLDSTARQIHLQRLLGLPTPTYLHLPVAVNANGEKLSKQTGAAPVGPESLPEAFRFLGHALPSELTAAPTGELMAWGIAHWNVANIPKARSIGVSWQEG
jgi:glutamyl-Q tRNA(Asp) synthetase